MRQLTPELAARQRLPFDQGIIISRLDPDGRAADAGLQVGDIVLMVNNATLTTVRDFKTALQQGKTQPYIRFLVQRQQSRLFIVVKLGD